MLITLDIDSNQLSQKATRDCLGIIHRNIQQLFFSGRQFRTFTQLFRSINIFCSLFLQVILIDIDMLLLQPKQNVEELKKKHINFIWNNQHAYLTNRNQNNFCAPRILFLWIWEKSELSLLFWLISKFFILLKTLKSFILHHLQNKKAVGSRSLKA